MSKRNWILAVTLAAVVIMWPVAGAVSAGGSGNSLAGLAPSFDGADNPGNGPEGDQPDAPGENASDDPGGEMLLVGVVDGTLGPNETVTIEVTQGDETVAGATVHVNDDDAGSTGENGTATFTVPNEEDVEIDIEHNDTGSELEFEFDYDDERDDGDDEEDEREDDENEDEEDEREDDENEDEEDEREDDDDRKGGNGNGPM